MARRSRVIAAKAIASFGVAAGTNRLALAATSRAPGSAPTPLRLTATTSVAMGDELFDRGRPTLAGTEDDVAVHQLLITGRGAVPRSATRSALTCHRRVEMTWS